MDPTYESARNVLVAAFMQVEAHSGVWNMLREQLWPGGRPVKLIYFRSGGKYYSEGEYVSQKVFEWDIIDEVVAMEKVPGMNTNWAEDIILVEAQDGVPRLITPELREVKGGKA